MFWKEVKKIPWKSQLISWILSFVLDKHIWCFLILLCPVTIKGKILRQFLDRHSGISNFGFFQNIKIWKYVLLMLYFPEEKLFRYPRWSVICYFRVKSWILKYKKVRMKKSSTKVLILLHIYLSILRKELYVESSKQIPMNLYSTWNNHYILN